MVYTEQEIAEMYFEEFGTLKLDDKWAGTAYAEAYAHYGAVDYPEFVRRVQQCLEDLP